MAYQGKYGGRRLEEILDESLAHKSDFQNPHGVTKAQLGLGNVDNTPDQDKPLSTPQKAALDEAVTALQKDIQTAVSMASIGIVVDGDCLCMEA